MHEYGGPEKLIYQDYRDPPKGRSEVLVRVAACGVNHLDIWVRRGVYRTGLPRILGSDISGVVEEGGGRFEKGEKVVVNPVLGCGVCNHCMLGEENRCGEARLVGSHVDGGYAELVSVPIQSIIPIPEGLSFEDAACIPVNFGTAWSMLVSKAKVSPKDTVLILGAGSGVGSAAVRIAKLFGAEVIATAGSEWKLKRATALGADHVVNHSEQDLEGEVRQITKGRGVDVVFEHVGSATWEKSVRSLARGGRLVTCGATTGSKAEVDIRDLYRRELEIYGDYVFTKRELYIVIELFSRGVLKSNLDRVMSLKDVREAHRLMEGRGHFGKLVLKP